MSISLSVFLFFSIVAIYLFIIEIFTVIFRITGLSYETANYQAISLLTTCGFTTSESEIVLTTKHRRQVAKWAMLFGYMFSVILATSIINIIISATRSQNEESMYSLFFIIFVPLFFIVMFKLKSLRRVVDNLIKKVVETIFMKKVLINPFYVLEMYGKEAICELLVTHVPNEIAGKTIFESGVRNKYGISYISINRKNENRVIDPFSDIIIRNDKVVIYGKPSVIHKVFRQSISVD